MPKKNLADNPAVMARAAAVMARLDEEAIDKKIPHQTVSRNWGMCDICSQPIHNAPGQQLYLVPFRSLKHSDLCLCRKCLLAKEYTMLDVKRIYEVQ